MRVYVAGLIALGNQLEHFRNAIDAADKLLIAGHTPFVPHLDYWWHVIHPHTPEEWLKWDFEWLKLCEALVRLPGESKGADHEVRVANHYGIPVYYGVENFFDAVPQPDTPEFGYVVNCEIVMLRSALEWAARQIGCPRITGVVGHSALETHSCPACAALAITPSQAKRGVGPGAVD